MAEEHDGRLHCPSAQPDWRGSGVFGVVQGAAQAPRVSYLTERLPVTGEILALTAPLPPAEVLRISAPCARRACQHFRGGSCSLVERVVARLEPVSAGAPDCAIRDRCRWLAQEGDAACQRCPQIITQQATLDETLHAVAAPE